MKATRSPGRTDPSQSSTLVGRDHELDELQAGFLAAAGGQARLFLLYGEPGIGKTRLAQELARFATEQRFQVVWGRCWEDAGAPPYWPWVQILRPLLRGLDFGGLRKRWGAGASALAQILPELRTTLGNDPSVGLGDVLDAAAARFSLFEIVADSLREVTEHSAAVLIFDDLHAADEASLQLLQFVARELQTARLLLLGTYRDVEVQRDPRRAELINAVARNGKRIPLAGLSLQGVGELLRRHMGCDPPSSLIARVHQVTEGNPFFVDEIVRMLAAQQREQPDAVLDSLALRIPHGVRETIGERLRYLSPPCRDLLRLAAALGREFETPSLGMASGMPLADALNRLGEAAGLGVVESVGDTLERYRFTHGLIRDVLYDEIPPGERARIHGRIGLVLESIVAQQRDAYLPELARHFLHALPCGEGERAVAYAMRAAQVATEGMAYEDAALHYLQALGALEHVDPTDKARRCELLIELGAVQRASGSDAALATFEDAAVVARELGSSEPLRSAELLARAAFGFADHGLGIPLLVGNPRVIALLEEALEGLPKADSALRARILGRLSVETTLAYEAARSQALSAEAVAMARRVGDATTLATTLSYRHFVLWRLDYMADRLGIVAEIIELADRIRHKELSLQGHSWRLVDLMSVGEWLDFDRELPVQAKAAEELRQPRYIWTTTNMRVARALWRGDWDQAESLAQESLEIGQRIGDPTTVTTPVAQTFLLRREQGRLAEIESLHRMFAERYRETPTPQSTLALIYAELDRREEARERFEIVAADNFEQIEREFRIGILPHLAEVCSYLEDRSRAARLYELLKPYAEICVPYGATANFGAAGTYLGLLAATMAEWRVAEGHFTSAVELNRRLKGLPWLARTQFAYARMLVQQGVRVDDRKCAELLDGAATIAQALAMVRLSSQIEDVRARHIRAAPSHGSPAVPSPSGVMHAVFRLEGDYWLVGDSTTRIHMKDSKGMRYIAYLLRHAGREFHATDLASIEAPDDAGQTISRARHVESPMLDARAKREYKQRIGSLREQFEEATSFNDLERAGRLQQELEVVTQELSRGLGLHGRDRSAGSYAERARLNVTRAIKSVVRRIARESDTFGRYLQTTIRTGAFCSYVPDPRLPVEWSL